MDFGQKIDALILFLTQSIPELSHIIPNQILPVFASAYGESRASVRSLLDCAKSIQIYGQTKTIELALRPLFFQSLNSKQRLVTLIHELLHIDFDHESAPILCNLHENISRKNLSVQAAQLAQKHLNPLDIKFSILNTEGEIIFQQWLIRPTPNTKNRAFNEKDIIDAILLMD